MENTDFLLKSGLYLLNDGEHSVLMYNGEPISTKFTVKKPRFGTAVRYNCLEVEGAPVAASSRQNPDVRCIKREVYFGGVKLIDNGEVINITEEDYNRLLAGENVAGYKSYDPSTIYNITADPSSAPQVSYTVEDGVITFSGGQTANVGEGSIYGNVTNQLTENTEDPTATIESTECPVVHVRYFNPVVEDGATLKLDYFVDTKHMASVLSDTIHDTFTVIVTTPNGTVKKTTYAGFASITLPQFTLPQDKTKQIQWFTVRCIDSNGVSSIVQYFDVMVKAQHTDVLYPMTEEDLETYGIVPNNDDPQVAFANKAALTNFFSVIKAMEDNGVPMYDGVLMYNDPTDNDGKGTIYYLDYHATFGTQTFYKCELSGGKITKVEEVSESAVTDQFTVRFKKAPKVGDDCSKTYVVVNTSTFGANVVFPNYFTIDLNGTTIAAAPYTDVYEGQIICLRNNIDTHIVNGTLKGSLSWLDYPTARRRAGNNMEHISVVEIVDSKYCSFENLDISGSFGYDGELSSASVNVGDFLYHFSDRYPGINLHDIESFDFSTGQETTAESTYDESSPLYDGMVCTDFWSIGGNALITMCRGGNATHFNMGKERIIYFCFYGENEDFIDYVKSAPYKAVMTPQNCRYVKIVGYGKMDTNWNPNNEPNWAPPKGWSPSGDKDWAPSSGKGSLLATGFGISRNIVFRNCHWHDTFTTALTNWMARGLLMEGCTFENIAIGVPGITPQTPLLGDLEDSHEWASDLCMRNCRWIPSSGYNEIKVYYADGFDFINNDGFYFFDCGGVVSGVFEGNTFSSMRIERNRNCYFPSVVYRNNTINTLSVGYGKWNYGDVDWTRVGIEAEKVVAMVDTTIANKCSYSNLKLKRSKNGDKIFN